MVEVSESFNYDLCMDLIKLTNSDGDSDNFWPIILAVFGQKANKKSFFYGRRVGPTLADVELIVTRLGSYKDRIEEQTWQQMCQVLKFLTQKSLNSAELEIENRTQLVKF